MVVIRPTPILKRRRSDHPEDADVIVVEDNGPPTKRDKLQNYSDDISIRSSKELVLMLLFTTRTRIQYLNYLVMNR